MLFERLFPSKPASFDRETKLQEIEAEARQGIWEMKGLSTENKV